jgi:hypothetical protein
LLARKSQFQEEITFAILCGKKVFELRFDGANAIQFGDTFVLAGGYGWMDKRLYRVTNFTKKKEQIV